MLEWVAAQYRSNRESRASMRDGKQGKGEANEALSGGGSRDVGIGSEG